MVRYYLDTSITIERVNIDISRELPERYPCINKPRDISISFEVSHIDISIAVPIDISI